MCGLPLPRERLAPRRAVVLVAFLSGPIAARLVGPNGSLDIPAALVGAAMVLLADLVGQNLLGTRFPVGVVTGVLGWCRTTSTSPPGIPTTSSP